MSTDESVVKKKYGAGAREVVDRLATQVSLFGTYSVAASAARSGAEEAMRALEGMRRAYPGRVKDGKMTQADADRQIMGMDAAYKTCVALAREFADWETAARNDLVDEGVEE